jgi:hypothetical protein
MGDTVDIRGTQLEMKPRSGSADVVDSLYRLVEPVVRDQMDVETGGTYLLSQKPGLLWPDRRDFDGLFGPLGPDPVGGREEVPNRLVFDISFKQRFELAAEIGPVKDERAIIHQPEALEIDHRRTDLDLEILGHVRWSSH